MRFLLLLLLFCLPAAADGKFILDLQSPRRQRDPLVELFLKNYLERSQLPDIVQYLNDTFILPRNIPIKLTDANVINAWYSPSEHSVTFTYDFLEFVCNDALKERKSGREAGEFLWGAMTFVLLHEVGHALIGEMDLPVVGREEDAADEFAVMMLLQSGEAGKRALSSASDWFSVLGSRRKEFAMWDEHSLDEQRFYNILLLLYGHSPQEYSIYTVLSVPKSRIERAVYDYQVKAHRWFKLLNGHTRREFRS